MPHKDQIEQIEQTIKDFLLKEFLPDEDPAELTRSTPLISTGIIDSIGTLKLVTFLESEFSVGIQANEADADHLDAIEDISALVQSKL